MRLLITRPEPDGTALVRELERRGHEGLMAPMMEIVFLQAVLPNIRSAQGLVFTSANGVRAFAKVSNDRSLKAYCVGDATAAAAKNAGFGEVRCGQGDVETLARLIEKECPAENGPLIHISGSVVARELTDLLGDRGVQIKRVVLYRANKSESLTADIVSDLRAGRVEGAIFYSPRTARIFSRVIQSAQLASACKSMKAFCLSEAVASELSGLPFRGLDIAAKPTQDALLKLLPACSH